MPEGMFVGIDVSKARLDVAVLPSGEVFAVDNSASGLAELLIRLSDVQPQRVVLEATGGLEQAAMLAIHDAGFPVTVLNPRQVRHFSRALGKHAKTDQIDAVLLAKFAQILQPQAQVPGEASQRALEALLARRRQMVELLTMERNRLHSSHDPYVQRDLQEVITYLESRRAQLDQALLNAAQGRRRHPISVVREARLALGYLKRRSVRATAGGGHLTSPAHLPSGDHP